MALKSTFKNMVICLTLICVVCSALLAGVYALTAAPIEKAAAEKLTGAISEVLPPFETLSEQKTVELSGKTYSYYEVSDAEGNVLGYAVNAAETGFGGPVSLMVGVLADGTLYNTKVLSHSETPGLGAKCTEPAFADQFRNLDLSVTTLSVKKDGGDIDAITAATITSRAYVKTVALALDVFNAIKGENVDAVDGASTAVNNGGSENE